MIAYEVHAKPDFDALTRVERQSKALGDHDVRVRVRAVALNYRDIVIARGASLRPNAAHVIAASDCAGEVIEIGSAVTRFRGGERVAALFCPTWLDGEF